MNTEINKRYIIKLPNGLAHRVQRSQHSGDVGPAVYKTLAGAERAAAKVQGGVFTVYVADDDYAVEAEALALGIRGAHRG